MAENSEKSAVNLLRFKVQDEDEDEDEDSDTINSSEDDDNSYVDEGDEIQVPKQLRRCAESIG